MHVQRDEHAATQDARMDGRRLVEDQLERGAIENLAQLGPDFLFPCNTHGAVLHYVEQGGVRLRFQARLEHGQQALHAQFGQFTLRVDQRTVQLGQQIGPACRDLRQQLLRLLGTVAQHFSIVHAVVGRIVALADWQVTLGKERAQGVSQLQLVLDRQFDIDALDAIRVFAHAVQGNDDVFIDFKSVGVLGDRGRAGTI
ncbi:hypothetical protein D3C72_1120720 [compost metagenome]